MLATALLTAPPAPIDIPRGGDGLPITVFAGDGPVLKPLDRFAARAWLAWDDHALTARFRVVDKTPQTADAPDRLYEGDSVELVVRHGEDVAQIVAAPGGLLKPSKPTFHLFDYRSGEIRAKAKLTGTATGERTDDGYEMTVTIPWSAFAYKPTEGDVVAARVGVNDAEPGAGRTQLRWLGGRSDYDFMQPAPIRLAATATAVPDNQAWLATFDRLDKVAVNLVADASLVGKAVEVRDGGKVLASGTAASEGGLAVCRLVFDAPTVLGNVDIAVDGGVVRSLQGPDLPAERKRLFMAGERGGRGWNFAQFERTTLPDENLPKFDYADRAAIERLVGPIRIETTYYDADGNPVDKAAKLGRYGAIAKVTAGDLTYTVYRTLFRADGKVENDQKADRNYWHALRKRLGCAIHYEWYAKAPDNYDASRDWPLIVYLHGSGGGDPTAWDNTKIYDGPMGPAHTKKGFPFVVVALRSPGGWFAPAVQDAIDEVEAKYHIDKTRVYQTGFSMGGMGTWQVSYDRPERFAAISPVGGRDGDASLMPLLKHMPVWVFNGRDDPVTTPADAKRAVAELKRLGTEVKYTEIPNAGHVESLRYAYAQASLYEWFLRHHR